MLNLKSFLVSTITVTIIALVPVVTYAESVRFVHWWNEYLPHHGNIMPGTYSGRKYIQYQDVNFDKVYNDTLIWYNFSMTEHLSPSSQRETGQSNHRYRDDLPSARFYGGIVARLTNVSHVTQTDTNGNKLPFFRKIQQATVEDNEGARPCSYSTKFPHNTGRLWSNTDYIGTKWGDMTVMVMNEGGGCCSVSDKFQETKDAEVNFTSVFLWKKEDFINGGAKVNQIIFDETSKLSVDMARFRLNIEEGRFVVQDGNQWWISEGAIVPDEEGKFSNGVKGVKVESFRKGVIVELNPLNSRWAVYNPSPDEEKVNRLFEELEQMEFDPKKASAEEQALYQEKSDQLLEQINKMEFNPARATFVDHRFEDVQAMGVYFATYQFAHKAMQMVFDNFQAYAAGDIPKGKAGILTNRPENQSNSRNKPALTGGMSINCGPVEQVVTLCSPDRVDFSGEIIVNQEDIGKQADLLLAVGCKQYPENEEEIFYLLDDQAEFNELDDWNEIITNPAQLDTFQKNVLLSQEVMQINMGGQVSTIFEKTDLCGKMEFPVFLRVFFGYRVSEEDGSRTVVYYNEDSIDMIINPENLAPNNEMPYSESIKDKCSIIN